jgi:RecA-family ATPase
MDKKIGTPAGDRQPFERRLSEYPERRISWLWRAVVPKNAVVLFEGEGEVGKSRVARYVAAKMSSGGTLSGEEEAAAAVNVLICSFSEDPVEEVTRPQIRKMGGNLQRVFIVEKPFTFDAAGLKELQDAIVRRRIGLVIMDPLADYIPSKANTYRDEEVRRMVMGPLTLLARKHKLSIIAIRHFKKSREEGIKYRAAGSMGFSNVGRIVVAFLPDPDEDEQAQIFVMGISKTNWIPRSKRRVLRFQIVETEDERGRLRWLGESTRSMEELDAEWRKKMKGGGELKAAAKKFLLQALANGPVLVSTLKQQQPNGMSWRTIERAKRAAGVVVRGGYRDKPAEWLLRKDATGIVIDFGAARHRWRSSDNLDE